MSFTDRLRRRGKKESEEKVEEVSSEESTVVLTKEEWVRVQRSIKAGESAYDTLSLEEQVSLLGFARVAFPDEKLDDVEDGRRFIESVVKNKSIDEIVDNFKKAERYISLGKAALKGNEALGSRFDGMIIRALERVAEGKVHLEQVPSSEDAKNVEYIVKAASDAFFAE
ncbi:MAG: hypothetical protein SVM80_10570 [Halobacteriota archaeon]|nr:hypothetical protein [Halobacteriota archaeon]